MKTRIKKIEEYDKTCKFIPQYRMFHIWFDFIESVHPELADVTISFDTFEDCLYYITKIKNENKSKNIEYIYQ